MSFYTALTGLNAASAQLGVSSNNIANVGTIGFKKSRAQFGDIFATSPLQKNSGRGSPSSRALRPAYPGTQEVM